MPAPTTLATLLLTAGAPVPAEELARWSPDDCAAADEWARHALVREMGCCVRTVRVPARVRPFLLGEVA